jgi:glyoxylate utilization-related uncharacterized protein
MQTRGIRGRAYTLLTPDNHYISRLPSLPGVELVKLVSPRLAPARIAQTLLRIPPAGVRATIDTELETFLFGLSGELTVTCNGGDAPLGRRPHSCSGSPGHTSAGRDSTSRPRSPETRRR